MKPPTRQSGPFSPDWARLAAMSPGASAVLAVVMVTPGALNPAMLSQDWAARAPVADNDASAMPPQRARASFSFIDGPSVPASKLTSPRPPEP